MFTDFVRIIHQINRMNSCNDYDDNGSTINSDSDIIIIIIVIIISVTRNKCVRQLNGYLSVA